MDKKYFNIAGPCIPGQHYMLPPLERALEMASGRERLDLCVHYQGGRYPIELKIRYSEQTYAQGQDQLAEYLDTLGCDEGWLLVFDRRPNVAWNEKIFWRTAQRDGKTIHIVGC